MSSRQEALQADWEPHRREIHTLYVTKDKSLKDVMMHMAGTYDFHAR